jgi:peptide/nickel transport system ATP-binding protein
MPKEPVVTVEQLSVRFVGRDATVGAVNDVSFSVDAGRVLGILGESGSGKSVTLRALLRLLPPRTRVDGRIRVAGHDMMTLDEAGLRQVRGSKVAMIFQEPMIALDPVFCIGVQIAETIVRHEGVSYQVANRRALELLDMVQIPSAARRLKSYPHELSGGMRQRVPLPCPVVRRCCWPTSRPRRSTSPCKYKSSFCCGNCSGTSIWPSSL